MDKKQASGMAGVYYTAAELSKRNFISLVTIRNVKATDVVAINDNTGKSANIQVKTNGTPQNFWLLSKSDQKNRPTNSLYVFVQLNKNKGPDFYIVPASYVKQNMVEEKAKTGSVWYSIEKWVLNQYHEKWEIFENITQ